MQDKTVPRPRSPNISERQVDQNKKKIEEFFRDGIEEFVIC